MQSVDGDVRLNIKASVQSAEQSVQKLSDKIKKVLNFGTGSTKPLEDGFNRVAQKAQQVSQATNNISDSKFISLKNKVQETADALELAKRKQSEFNAQKTPTEKYSALQSRIKDLQNEADQLYRIAEKDSQGSPVGGWEAKIESVRAEISKLIQEQHQLEQSGQAYQTDSVKAQQYANAVAKASNAHEVAKAKLNEYTSAQQQSTNATQQNANATSKLNSTLKNTASSVGKTISSIGSYIGKVGRGIGGAFSTLAGKTKTVFSGIRSHLTSTKKTSQSSIDGISSNVKRGLKMLLRYGIGVRGLFVLFRKLRTAAKEGFKNLGGYSDSFNTTVSNLLSASAKLKNAFAAAFQPLASVVLPILTRAVNTLSDMLNKLAQFFAALTGQKYAYQAVDTTVKYVEDKAKKTVKKVQKYLSPLDDINLFNEKDTDTSSESDSFADPKTMFKTVTVDSAYKKLADKIRSYFKDIFKPIKQAWDKYGNGVIKAWRKALSSVWKLIKAIARDFRAVWTDGTGFRLVANLLRIFRLLGQTVDTIATQLRNAWNENNRGVKLIKSILRLFTQILGVIGDIIKAFNDALATKTGKQMFAFTLEIATNLFNIAGNLIASFRKAWSKNGKELFVNIFKLINTVLRGIKGITGAIKNWAKEIDFAPIIKSITNLVKALTPLVDLLMNGLNWTVKNVILPLLKFLIENGIPTVINNIAKFTTKLTKALSGLSSNPFFTNVSQTIPAFINPLIENAGKVKEAFDNLYEAIKKPAGVLSQIFGDSFIIASKTFRDETQKNKDKISDFVSNTTTKLKSITTVIKNVTSDISDILLKWWNGEGEDDESSGKKTVENIASTFSDIGYKLLDVYNKYIAPTVDKISTKFQELWDGGLKDTFNDLLETISLIGEVFSLTWNNKVKPLLDIIAPFIEPIIDNIVGFVTSGMKLLGALIGSIIKIIKGVLKIIKGQLTLDWKTAWDGFVDVLKGIINAITGVINFLIRNLWQHLVKNVANAIWAVVKSVVAAVNIVLPKEQKWKVPSNPFGINFDNPPQIPKLATGAVIPPNKEFMAVLGDQKQGNNIEAPENLIRRIVREESGNTYTVNAKVGSKTLFSIILDEAKLKQVQTGHSPFDMIKGV